MDGEPSIETASLSQTVFWRDRYRDELRVEETRKVRISLVKLERLRYRLRNWQEHLDWHLAQPDPFTGERRGRPRPV